MIGELLLQREERSAENVGLGGPELFLEPLEACRFVPIEVDLDGLGDATRGHEINPEFMS